jgi:hypothetical protein
LRSIARLKQLSFKLFLSVFPLPMEHYFKRSGLPRGGVAFMRSLFILFIFAVALLSQHPAYAQTAGSDEALLSPTAKPLNVPPADAASTPAKTSTPAPTNPASTYDHCKIDGTGLTSDCPGMNPTSLGITSTERGAATMPVWSGQAGKAPAQVAIDLNNICRWVDNAAGNPAKTEILVPFKTDYEWGQFFNAANKTGAGPSQFVFLNHCSRPAIGPSILGIPSNDPAQPPSDSKNLCYQSDGKTLNTDTLPYAELKYGRWPDDYNPPQVIDTTTANPPMAFTNCYDSSGNGPWTKTVLSITLRGYDAERDPSQAPLHDWGSTHDLANSDWKIVAATYSGVPPVAVNGTCGTANGQNYSSAPAGNELCSTGTAAGFSGGSEGPWTWTCDASGSGTDSPPCTTKSSGKACPAAIVQGDMMGSGILQITYVSIEDPASMSELIVSITATRIITDSEGDWTTESFLGGACVLNSDYDSQLNPGDAIADRGALSSCVATVYAQQNLPGYAHCTPGPVTDLTVSPVKVNLAGSDATMNSATPTSFLLTLKDGRKLDGHVTGGLNADEGWLMVRRDAAALVLDNGALNADDWFGDRDHRSLNGYTDLAETFSAFLVKDEFGQRYIPLHKLAAEDQKAMNAATVAGKITDPSYNLRVVDAKNDEHLASDYFSRVYVDSRNVVEGDGPDGKSGDNLILERALVRTVDGAYHASVDQWFVLDLPAGYAAVDHPTRSKVLPAQTAGR